MIPLTEKSMNVGSLVQATHDISTIPQNLVEHVKAGDVVSMLPEGTVGIILELSTSRNRRFLVQWVGGHEWWMYTNEIRPYILG